MEEQQARRDVLLDVFSPDEVRMMSESWLARAKAGDMAAIAQAAPYIFGSPRQELAITGADGGPLVFTIRFDRKDDDGDGDSPAA